MTIKQIFNKFVSGDNKGKCASVFIEDNILYSYGYHFPLAIRLNDSNGFKFIINKSKYSQTTSKQQTYLLYELNDSNIIGKIETNEIKDLVNERIKDVNAVILKRLKGDLN